MKAWRSASRNVRIGLSLAGIMAMAGTTVVLAQPHRHDHHDPHHPGSGIHPPHYPGVPHHARDTVRVHGDHGPVVFYWLDHHSHHDHHGHRDYYCLHEGHPTLIGFRDRSHVHDLAHGLREIMELAHDDMVANYQHNHGFDVTDQEMHQFIECVTRLDNAAAQGNYEAAIDELAHFIDDLEHLAHDVGHWHRHPHQQIGRGGLLTKIADARSIVTHLSNDLGFRPDRPHPIH